MLEPRSKGRDFIRSTKSSFAKCLSRRNPTDEPENYYGVLTARRLARVKFRHKIKILPFTKNQRDRD